MTVTVYSLSFINADGGKVRASIFWDKYTPKRLKATLCPHITELEVDYPTWSVTAPHNRKGLDLLIEKTKKQAAKMDLTLTSEKETASPVR
jgi:hypothetical protein